MCVCVCVCACVCMCARVFLIPHLYYSHRHFFTLHFISVVEWTCTATECILPTGLTMNYTNGEAFCAERDAHLVTIDSSAKSTSVKASFWGTETLYFLGYYRQNGKWLDYDGNEPGRPSVYFEFDIRIQMYYNITTAYQFCS